MFYLLLFLAGACLSRSLTSITEQQKSVLMSSSVHVSLNLSTRKIDSGRM